MTSKLPVEIPATVREAFLIASHRYSLIHSLYTGLLEKPYLLDSDPELAKILEELREITLPETP